MAVLILEEGYRDISRVTLSFLSQRIERTFRFAPRTNDPKLTTLYDTLSTSACRCFRRFQSTKIKNRGHPTVRMIRSSCHYVASAGMTQCDVDLVLIYVHFHLVTVTKSATKFIQIKLQSVKDPPRSPSPCITTL
jgi:hypothetical protein